MREHYALVLNLVGGRPVTIFVGYIAFLEEAEDGTCTVHMVDGTKLRVRESEETIVTKAKGHNVIVRIS